MLNWILLTQTLYINCFQLNLLDSSTFFLMALSQIEGIGDVNAKKLIAHCGSAEAVFKEKKSSLTKIKRLQCFLT